MRAQRRLDSREDRVAVIGAVDLDPDAEPEGARLVREQASPTTCGSPLAFSAASRFCQTGLAGVSAAPSGAATVIATVGPVRTCSTAACALAMPL